MGVRRGEDRFGRGEGEGICRLLMCVLGGSVVRVWLGVDTLLF